jgi:uncharacterized membrane protein
MKSKIIFSFLLILSILSASCTKELKYTKEQLLKKAQAADPSVSVMLPQSMNDGIKCSDYLEGCLSGHIVRVKGLDMIAVEFMTEDQAKRAASKVKGFYSRNWIFDDVRGEPVLEEFVQKHLEAKSPDENFLKK